jgi:hypothetical protein
VLFVDFDLTGGSWPDGYARGIQLVGAVEGFQADVRIYGFAGGVGTSEVFLELPASIKGCHIVVHGNSADDGVFPATPTQANIAKYVNVPSPGFDNSNTITFINDATQQSVTLLPNTVY